MAMLHGFEHRRAFICLEAIRERTTLEGRSDAFPSLNSDAGVGKRGDLHTEKARQHRCEGAKQEGNRGKRSVDERWRLSVFPLRAKAILRPEQHKDQRRHQTLRHATRLPNQ